MILASQSCRDSERAPPLSFIPLFLGASRELIYPTFINMLAQQNTTQTCPDSARGAATTVHFPRAFFHSRLMPFRERAKAALGASVTHQMGGRVGGRAAHSLCSAWTIQRRSAQCVFSIFDLSPRRALSRKTHLCMHTHAPT